ncbi:MAG: hypothetical protein FIB01_10305 [Gemmatimonadetes bacterium]|nr:hypothetical protein [Gemmatimonadota bacterium]
MRSTPHRSRGWPLAAALAAAVLACGDTATPGRPAAGAGPADGTQPDRVLVKPELRLVLHGTRYAVLQADSMNVYEDSTTARVFGLRLQLLDTLGSRIAEISAPAAHYQLRTQKLLATGGAVVIGPGSGRIETEALNLDPDARRIWSDAETRVQWAGGGSTVFDTFTVDDRFLSPRGTNPKGPSRGAL